MVVKGLIASDGFSAGIEADPMATRAEDAAQVFADAPNRLVGYLIDAAILTMLSFVGAIAISLVFGPIVSIDAGADPQVSVDRGLALANALLGTAISAAYFVAGWRALGGSPGQRLLRMHVGTSIPERVSLPRWLVRWTFIGLPVAVEGILSALASGWVVLLGAGAVALWFALLLLSIARSATKQGWHDRWACTIVTKAVRPVPRANLSRPEPHTRVH